MNQYEECLLRFFDAAPKKHQFGVALWIRDGGYDGLPAAEFGELAREFCLTPGWLLHHLIYAKKRVIHWEATWNLNSHGASETAVRWHASPEFMRELCVRGLEIGRALAQEKRMNGGMTIVRKAAKQFRAEMDALMDEGIREALAENAVVQVPLAELIRVMPLAARKRWEVQHGDGENSGDE